MTPSLIEIAATDTCWTLTLNRADKANALSKAMLEDLDAAVAGAQSAGARVLVITGRGKVFSAGADLEEVQGGTLATDPIWEQLSGRIASFRGLTICALNGTCAGGAVGMMLACDLRVAVEGAKVFYPVLKIGVLPQPSDPARMARLIGEGRAKLVLLGGTKVETRDAVSWGLFDRVVRTEDMGEMLATLSADAERATPSLLGSIKSLF